MAAEYFLYTTLYNNTLVERSKTSFAPLPPNTGEIFIDYFIPPIQPLYLYRESGGTIILNDEQIINEYLNGTALPLQPDDNVEHQKFTGYTAQTTNQINYLSGQTDMKHDISDFNLFTGTTFPMNYYNKTDINNYSAKTDTNINTKINKVIDATDNLAIFTVDGNVKDSKVTIDSITGGSGFYYYIDKIVTQSTTSTSNVVYLSGTSDVLTAGTWSVDFNAIGGNGSSNAYIGVSFYIDNVLQGVENYFKNNDANVVIPFVIIKDLDLIGGIHTFEIRFRNVGGTAMLKYGAIRAKMVN